MHKTLIVTVKSARYMKNTELLGKQDPYLVVFTNKDPTSKSRTKVHDNGGEHATWNETFTMNFVDVPGGQPLWIYVEVWNKNTLVSDKLIGKVKQNVSTGRCQSIYHHQPILHVVPQAKFSGAALGERPQEDWVKIYRDNKAGDIGGEVRLECSVVTCAGQVRHSGTIGCGPLPGPPTPSPIHRRCVCRPGSRAGGSSGGSNGGATSSGGCRTSPAAFLPTAIVPRRGGGVGCAVGPPGPPGHGARQLRRRRALSRPPPCAVRPAGPPGTGGRGGGARRALGRVRVRARGGGLGVRAGATT